MNVVIHQNVILHGIKLAENSTIQLQQKFVPPQEKEVENSPKSEPIIPESDK